MSSYEEFLDMTGDDTLRRLYVSCGDMAIAEELFVEVYLAVHRCPLSRVPWLRRLVLYWTVFCLRF